MDLKHYQRLKAMGRVAFARLSEDRVVGATTLYDPHTGLAVVTEEQFLLKDVRAQLADAEARYLALKELLADLEATEIVKPLAPAPKKATPS